MSDELTATEKNALKWVHFLERWDLIQQHPIWNEAERYEAVRTAIEVLR